MSEFINVFAQHQNRNSSFETKNFFESTTSFVSNSFINSFIISDSFQSAQNTDFKSNSFINSSVISDSLQSVQNTDSKSEFVRIESRNLFQTKSFLLKKKRSIIKTLRRIRRLNEKKDHLLFMIESKFNSAKNNEDLWKKIKKKWTKINWKFENKSYDSKKSDATKTDFIAFKNSTQIRYKICFFRYKICFHFET